MYRLSEHADLDFLKDKLLIQLCVGLHRIIMRFDNDISISIESVIKLLNNSGEDNIYADSLAINKDFLALLGNSVQEVMCCAEGALVLIFSNGSKLEITDDSNKYESYQILKDGKIIVVV